MRIAAYKIFVPTRREWLLDACCSVRRSHDNSVRLHLLPPLRWQLAEVPLGAAHPEWVDGPVDLDFHIREFALAARPATMLPLSQPCANLPLYLSIHFLRNLMRCMRGARHEVHEERFVRKECLLLAAD